MKRIVNNHLQIISTLIILFVLSGCKSRNRQIVSIFHAASLSGVLSVLEERMEHLHTDLDIRLEPSGSQIAARKVAELNRTADLVMVADRKVIDEILIPRFAGYNLLFASNAIVLAHADHSRHTEEIDSNNWYSILLRPEVRLGRTDENLAPIGYQTLQVWKLSESYYGADKTGQNLAGRLKNRCRTEHITPDISELVSLLEARVLDYAFVFRSMAEEHNLKITPLPIEVNLSNPNLNEQYAKVHVKVKMRMDQNPVLLNAEAVQYGLTIPNNAKNPIGARKIIEFLLSAEGSSLLTRFGFQPMTPARIVSKAPLPPWLSAKKLKEAS